MRPMCAQVENPQDAYYKLTNSHSQISSYVFDVVRARCGARGRARASPARAPSAEVQPPARASRGPRQVPT